MTKKLSASLIKMVHILSDGHYHDGNTLGEQLAMTRSAVWKAIKKLTGYAIKIDCVKGKGYALLEPLILLEQTKIKNLVQEKITLDVFESMTSTNDYLKTFRNVHEIKICLAEHMTKGRGRLNREWYAPFGKNIYMSCLYPLQKDVSELAGLSLVMTLAIIKTLKNFAIDQHLFVKWPNDIIYANKKMSGILIEIQAETHGHCQAIIGVGVNVNMLDDESAISQAWTSMQKILGRYLDRNIVCAALINNLLAYLQQFAMHGFEYFVEEWAAVDCLTQQNIILKNIDQEVRGKVLGVNDQGHLLMQLPNGCVHTFSAGDASIMKKV